MVPYCCVAIFHGDQKETIVIPNDLAKNTTPSYVAYSEDDDVTVGEAAKNLAHENPENTIFDVKRLIGRSYESVQKYEKLWPYQVINLDGHIGVSVQGKTLLPQNISKELIAYLLKCTEDYLQRKIDSAVVTVPAYFNFYQRQLTQEACFSAGLKEIHLISEPTAASLAYGLQLQTGRHRTCLIFDLGGGTFDIAVLRVVRGENVRIQIKAIGGDPRLGGGDFDGALLKYCMKEFKKIHGVDLAEGKKSEDPRIRFKTAKRLRRIRMECEKQKCYLSQTQSVTISLDAIHGDIDLAIPMTREMFENLINRYLVQCMDILDGIMEESGMGREKIDDVILIGGSSRIPKVQKLVAEYFEGKTLCKSIQTDEAVARGAAVHAYHFFNAKKNSVDKAILEKHEMMGYYAAVTDREMAPSLIETETETNSAGTSLIVNVSQDGQHINEMLYPDVIEEPYWKYKYIISLSSSTIYTKVIQRTGTNFNYSNKDSNYYNSDKFVVKYFKNYSPYISFRDFNSILIGKEAESHTTGFDTYNIVTLLQEKVNKLNPVKSFVRLPTEKIIATFFELVKGKMMKKVIRKFQQTSPSLGEPQETLKIDNHVIICSGNASCEQKRCLILASILAGFRQTNIVPFNVAQLRAFIESSGPPLSRNSPLSLTALRCDQVLVIHYTWSFFEAAVVTWAGEKRGTLSGFTTSRCQKAHETQKTFFHCHELLMKRVLTDRGSVPNESTHPALAYYRNLILGALNMARTDFERIHAVYVIFEEGCLPMKKILGRSLGLDRKFMTAIEEPNFIFEVDYLNTLFFPESIMHLRTRIYDFVPYSPHFTYKELKGVLPMQSYTKFNSNFNGQGLLTIHHSGIYQVSLHDDGKNKGSYKKQMKSMDELENGEMRDEDGNISELSMAFQVYHCQNGLYSLNQKYKL